MILIKEKSRPYVHADDQAELPPQPMVEIAPIKNEYAQEYHSILDDVAKEQLYLGMIEAPPLECVTEHVAECVKNDYPMFVAMENGKMVGWCSIYTNQTPNFKHLGQLFVGVVGSSRGKGIGRALITATLAKGWANGLLRVELDVCMKNTSAIGLYRTFGFIPEGIKRRAYLVQNAYEDLMVMSLLHDEV